ncbi:MAG: MFS transporter [Acidimicrobiaceae bacterium]|nr:MFS transporter [Acidimicrobiaceae bacterium]MXZ98536.1 MFS transporter [Acidimicrobiaceae bacterium]MYE75594.1 MFS transporter [Acidimicrobiaceae bacterium]MYE96276.1 MFS transporter [Acidimicrobiaceae bacterium]MYH44661.1 MFS transporter [Acidimicrobiaceae bacterium]
MGTLGFSVTAPILPDLADVFGVSRGSIGLVQGSISFAGVMFSAIIGYLADRIGRRRVILAALALFSVFGVAGFFARTFWALVTVRFLQGVGTSGILGVGIVLIGDAFEGAARTRAMGINMTGLQTTSLLGPVIAGLLAVNGTFRPFLIFLIGIPLAAWASRMPADRPTETVEKPLRHLRAALATMRREQTLADFAGVLAATFVATYLLHGLGLTVVPLLLDDEFGIEVAARGVYIAAFQLGIVLAAIRIGVLIDRMGKANLITAAFALMAGGSAVTALAPSANWVVAGLAVCGFGFGAFVPQAQAYAATVGGPHYRGLTVLVWVTIIRLSQLAGPPAGSMVYDATGPTVPFWSAAVVTGALAVAWIPVRRAVSSATSAAG